MKTVPSRPRAYSYIRMSTDIQLKGDSLRRQLEASASYAAANGLDLIDESRLEDIGISAFKGANVAGGALGRFLKAAKAGKIKRGSFLLVESLDRLSRQEVRKSLAVFLNIIDAGINIVTLADNRVYTADKTEELDLITSLVIMSRAHEESRTKSHRIGAAWANKRKQAHTRPITGMCPAWLKLSDDKTHYELIEKRARIVRAIFEDSAAGMGNYTVTRRLNQKKVVPFGRSKSWCTSYVSKIIINRAAIGEFQPHRIVNGKRVPVGDPIPNYFPAVVDEHLFYRAGSSRRQRTVGGGGRKGAFISNLFSGLAVCAYCKLPMRFINKGYGPRGGNYLVCDSARRGTGCETTGWRYDHFEASFLAFVQELDLGTLVGSEGDAKKRSDLEDKITALRGEAASVKEQMERTFELLSVAGTAANFVGEKLQLLESRRVAIEAQLQDGDRELSSLGATVSRFYESRDQIKALVKQLQSRQGEALYKLRAQIADRLLAICARLQVAPLGLVPQIKRQIKVIERESPDVAEIIPHLKRQMEEHKSRHRYFAVQFRDRTVRLVFPLDDDPLQFEEQRYSDAGGTKLIKPNGVEELLMKNRFVLS